MGERVTELGIQAVELCAVKSRSVIFIPGHMASIFLISERCLRRLEEIIIGIGVEDGRSDGTGKGLALATGDVRMGSCMVVSLLTFEAAWKGA